MPGPDYAGKVVFYEDFPYAWWNDFRRLDDLARRSRRRAAERREHLPEYADITDQIERKITGISLYESQLDRLFDGPKPMGDAVRPTAKAWPGSAASPGPAERYWATIRRLAGGSAPRGARRPPPDEGGRVLLEPASRQRQTDRSASIWGDQRSIRRAFSMLTTRRRMLSMSRRSMWRDVDLDAERLADRVPPGALTDVSMPVPTLKTSPSARGRIAARSVASTASSM